MKTIFQILHPLSCKYKDIHGIRPFNLSTWNCSEEFINKMTPYLAVPPSSANLFNYFYTDMLPVEKVALLDRLGFDPQLKDGIITSNGTSSLSLFTNWLNHQNFKKLHVVDAYYFSVAQNCKLHGIDIDLLQMGDINDNDNYHNEVFLFTNPYYSLGVSLPQTHIDVIAKILENNWVAVDECLANKGDELSHIFGNHPHFIGIYSPHKTVCLNGLKFSFIVFPKEFELFFAQSIDYLNGSISSSSLSGIKHYLSDNFDLYQQLFQKNIYSTHLFVKELLSEYPTMRYTGDGHHYFATIFVSGIETAISTDESWIWNIIEKSAAIFIPGYYNNYPNDGRFCFRINLTQDSTLFRKSLRCLLDVLQQYEKGYIKQQSIDKCLMFKLITLDDKDIITRFTQTSEYKIYDFSFSSMMIWSLIHQTKYSIMNDSLFIRFTSQEEGKMGYMMPIGGITIKQAVEMIEYDAQSHQYEFAIYGITQPVKEQMEHLFPDKFSYSFERDESDYIYMRSDLANLVGDKFQPKRNHVNRFKKNYNYQYINVTKNEVLECIELSNRWYQDRKSASNVVELDYERNFICDTLNHLNELGATCGAIKVDGRIVAFAIGAPINGDTFGVSIEKVNTEFIDGYAVINKEFAAHLPPQYLYINKEEDMGIEGLRKAKLSYHPTDILHKYKACIK